MENVHGLLPLFVCLFLTFVCLFACVFAAVLPLSKLIQMTIDYTRDRKIFGQPVLHNQAVHFRLAEMQTEIEALKSMLYRAVGKSHHNDYY